MENNVFLDLFVGLFFVNLANLIKLQKTQKTNTCKSLFQ